MSKRTYNKLLEIVISGYFSMPSMSRARKFRINNKMRNDYCWRKITIIIEIYRCWCSCSVIRFLIELFFFSLRRTPLYFLPLEYRKPSASATEAMDSIWQHRLRFKSLRFVQSSGEQEISSPKRRTKSFPLCLEVIKSLEHHSITR